MRLSMTGARLRTLILIWVVVVMAGAANGEDGLAMMKIEHGARQAGMGAASVSVTGDPNGASYNPATVVGVSKFTASFGHISYWENIRLESGYFAMDLSSVTFLHGGIRFAVVDELEQRHAPTLEPDELFDAHDISFKLGLACKFAEWLSGGFAVGWFFEKIEAWRGSAFNLDVGMVVRPAENVSVGAAATNLGADFSLSKPGVEGSRDISLPTRYAVGGSYRYHKALGALDLVVIDDEIHAHIGGEAHPHELFRVRAGYMTNYDSKNIAAGVSFTKRNLTVDYAFVPYTNDLGSSHMFNFSFTL